MPQKATKLEIYKLQIPTSASDPGGMDKVLAYNENRTVETFLNLPDVDHLFQEGELKIFVLGFVDRYGILQIYDRPRPPWQDW